MKKTIAVIVVLILGFGTVQAQDDVSIMDLKEVTYILLKKVEKLEKDGQKVLSEAKETSTKNISAIEIQNEKINSLSNNLAEINGREVLQEYRVSPELTDYLK